MRKRKSNFYLLLPMILMLLLTGTWACGKTDTQDLPEHLEAPKVLENENMSTGQETVWSCLYFGSYPAAEIVTEGWDAVDEYAVRDGDVIVDDKLYKKLSEADWEDDHVTLEGCEYVRMSSGQAVTANENREQHYRWKDLDGWHYFQKEPIRWRVLSVRDGKALLLADKIMDCAPFNLTDQAVTWETCTLRSWLNGYGKDQNADGVDYAGLGFYDVAFSSEEQEAILPVTCTTPANKDYGTDSGPDTQDKVFLLSNEEVYADARAAEYGFYAGRGYDDPSKRFVSTMYAKCRGAWWSPVSDYRGNSFWFMRTSGYTPYNVTYICDFGYVYSRGTSVTCDDAGVLPAICIDYDQADTFAAGEISSTEIIHKEEEEHEPTEPHDSVMTDDESLPGRKEEPEPTGLNDPEMTDDESLPGGKEEPESVGLHNPVMTDDESLPGGKNVTWSMVTFGTYPQTEIIDAGEAADGQEADSALWKRLKEASWDGETTGNDGATASADGATTSVDGATTSVDGETTSLDGVRYLRLNGRFFRYDPIVWRVLQVIDNTALLLADRALDCAPYHSSLTDVNWKDSCVRSWLNSLGSDENQTGEDFMAGGFFDVAFADEEKAAVLATPVENANNHYFGTSCGVDTDDRVFLLSENEIFSSPVAELYGFQLSDAVGDLAKRFVPTAYAVCRGAWQSGLEESQGNGFWILRSNGYTASNVVYVGELGYIYNRGIPVTVRDACVIPAIRVDLGLANLTYVGESAAAERVRNGE